MKSTITKYCQIKTKKQQNIDYIYITKQTINTTLTPQQQHRYNNSKTQHNTYTTTTTINIISIQ